MRVPLVAGYFSYLVLLPIHLIHVMTSAICTYWSYIYATTIGELSSKFDEFLAARSQFDSDHDQIWQACADRSGNGSYVNKLAP